MRTCLLSALAILLGGGPGDAGADDLVGRVEQLAQETTPAVIAWRRDIHAHPELGNREERTARLVAEQLRAMGVEEIRTGVAHHGVVGLIRGKQPGPTVALRADMDALPIREQSGVPFASQNDGVMHACGHDSHTAMLLGAARVLLRLRDRLQGNVKLVFQPAEEGVPRGETGGAAVMIAEGVLRNPDVAAIFALHINTELATGTIGFRPGVLMAGVDRFRVTVTGKQSHAAMPWQGRDPIVATAQIITAIQMIRSRYTDTRRPVVVSVGLLQAGTAWNIIPGQANFEGTVRTHDPDVRRQVAEEFARIVTQTALAHGTTAEIAYSTYGPMLWNDEPLCRQMRPTLVRAAGEKKVVEIEPVMGGEDFAHYAQKVPGLFCFLGVRNPAVGATHALHTPQMVIDEAALPVGVRTLALLAIDYLSAPPAAAKPTP